MSYLATAAIGDTQTADCVISGGLQTLKIRPGREHAQVMQRLQATRAVLCERQGTESVVMVLLRRSREDLSRIFPVKRTLSTKSEPSRGVQGNFVRRSSVPSSRVRPRERGRSGDLRQNAGFFALLDKQASSRVGRVDDSSAESAQCECH